MTNINTGAAKPEIKEENTTIENRKIYSDLKQALLAVDNIFIKAMALIMIVNGQKKTRLFKVPL